MSDINIFHTSLKNKGENMEFMLKVGDKAVYPGHGVGKITSIEDKDIMGNKLTFYSMEIMESGTKIMIPKNRLKSVGVRPVASKKQAKEVMSILSNSCFEEEQKTAGKNWQKRHQSYMDKIKTGSIYEIAKVIRNLNQIKEGKELSYGEKRMMDKAKNILYSELSLTIDKNELQVLSSQTQ